MPTGSSRWTTDNNDVYVLALVPDGDLAELEGMAHGMDGAAARAVAEGMVAMAREEAEGDARTWMAETERTVLALGAVDAETVQSGEVNMDPGASDRLVNAIGAGAVAALDACERMRREEAVAPVDCDAGAAYARAGGFTFRREEHEYVADVSACQRAIDRGETYEVCLTNELRRKGKVVGSNPSGAEVPRVPSFGRMRTHLRVRRIPRRFTLCFEGPTRRRTPRTCASGVATPPARA